MKPCDHDCHDIADKLIGPMRERARELGYALTVHGTLKRDIDLVACPWVQDCAGAYDLAEELRLVALKIHGAAFMKPEEYGDAFHRAGCPGMKPHGRLCWVYYLGGPCYIDLSVMPTTPEMETWESVDRTDKMRQRMEQEDSREGGIANE